MTRTCTYSSELDTVQLLAFLDGEAEAWIEEHLRQCEFCRERAEHLAKIEASLTDKLYRVDCPSSIELGEYHLNRLDAARSTVTSQHLGECPYCAHELAQLGSFMGELADDSEAGLMERAVDSVRVTVARLVSGPWRDAMVQQPNFVFAYNGIRGEEEAPIIYVADEIQITIDVRDDDTNPKRKSLLGFVIGADVCGLKAHLWRSNQFLAVVPLDELGSFTIPNLISDRYELILSDPNIEIHVQDLDI